MKIQGVFFDFDGTLADTKSLLLESYVQFMDSYNLTSSIEEFNSLNGTPIKASIVELCRRYRLKIDSQAIANSYVSKIETAYLEAPFASGAPQLIDYVCSKEIPIALVTSAPRDLISGWIEKKSLDGLFDVVVTSDDVTSSKPDPEPYLKAANQLGISSSNSLAIEDSETGVTSAISAGMFTIGLGLDSIKNFNSAKFQAVSDLIDAKNYIKKNLDL